MLSNKKLLFFLFHIAGGGAAYNLLEIAWRQYTHISMTLLGGLCFWMLVRLSAARIGLFWKSVIGGSLITVSEFIAGCVVNLWLGLNVWDYSGQPLHLLGQVSIQYFLLWWALSAIVIPAYRYLTEKRWFAAFFAQKWRAVRYMQKKEAKAG